MRNGNTLVEMDADTQLAETPTYPLCVERRRGRLQVRDAGIRASTARAQWGAYHRLSGETYPTVTAPKFTDLDGDMIIATDGTLKEGKGGAAYVINSLATPGILKAVLPVDSCP